MALIDEQRDTTLKKVMLYTPEFGLLDFWTLLLCCCGDGISPWWTIKSKLQAYRKVEYSF